MKIPLLVAHRGDMENCPENTLRSLESALRAGAPYVEFDVQSTADGHLVILHDSGLDRTTDRGGSVLDTPYPDLTAISAHEPDRFGDRFVPTPITPLSGIVPLLRRYPEARALVEIKSESLRRFGLAAVMDRLLKDIAPVADRCVVIGYDPEALRYVRDHSGLPIGWVIERYDEETRRRAEALAPDILIGETPMFPPEQPPWPGPWQWMLYDITDPELALAYAEDGVELIETRDIQRMYRDPRLARRRLTPTTEE